MKMLNLVAPLALLAVSITPVSAQAPASSVTTAQTSAEDEGHPTIPLAIWAPSTGSNLPLIVISHGTGAGMISHADTAEALARAGFIVVAPMHPGDNFQDDSAVGRPNWIADRSRQVSKVIDFMLSRWDGRARLDSQRVGIFGFSAGATTALVALGGVPDLTKLTSHCATQREFVCDIIPAVQTDAKTAPPQWTHDARIKAAVIAAPGLGFLFEPAGLSNVTAPVQLWAGSADETVPYASNAGVVRRLLPKQPEFKSVENAVHLSFLAPCTPQSPPPICLDQPGFDRVAFHQSFNRDVVNFFRRNM